MSSLKKHPKISLRTRLALEVQRLLTRENRRAHTLRQLFWECTLRCNLHCLHCGSDCKKESLIPDMEATDFLKAVDGLRTHVDPLRTNIVMTGGEPLLRNDLEEVGRQLTDWSFPWGMVTNGMLLSAARFDRLKEAGMTSMTISLDGLEEAHNWLRGHVKSHERALAAVKLLADKGGVAWDVVTCVNKRNLPTLPALKEELVKIGVKEWRLFGIFPAGRAAKEPELQLDATELQSLMGFIEATRREGRIDAQYACQGFLGGWEGRVRDHLFQCTAGVSVASILANGSISGCPSVRYQQAQGNIHTDDLWEVWEHRFEAYRHREWARKGACEHCPLWRYCEADGMHLHEADGTLMACHWKMLNEWQNH